MFQHQKMWLPDGEKHFPEWMNKSGELVNGRGTYQIKKWRACLPHIRDFRRAIDVGAHVGFWSIAMASKFRFLEAFEPVSAFRECWIANLRGGPEHTKSIRLHPFALGSRSGSVVMKIPPLAGGVDTGGTHVGEFLDGDRPDTIGCRTLDSFEFPLVDFLKIDCEGYEHHVVEGARATLERWKPVVIVEQKQHKLGPNFGIKGTPAVDLLKSLGYEVRAEISGDYIMTSRDAA